MPTPPVSQTVAALPREACYHCGQPVPRGADFSVTVDHAPRAMCCRGCQAVAQAIVDGGLADYYRHRTAQAATAREIVPEFLRETALYDHPEIQKSFVRERGGGLREASLMLENITCAACVWLNERTLAQLPGVREAHINYSTHRARVVWDDTRLKLSDILEAIARIGYLAHPYDPNRSQALRDAERKRLLRQLGVAALFGMQVMTLAEALYVGEWWGLDTDLQDFFLWISLLLTLPVLLYSSQPFFAGAWRDLCHRRAGMDIPIVLGIATAFAGSVWSTVTREGVAYYDSVTMFVFLLLGARYFEQRARARAGEAAERLARATPALATRVRDDGADESVAVAQLRPGDRVRVRPGESIPADGLILEGSSAVDESLISGESLPRPRSAGEHVIGGSINRESPLLVRAEKIGTETVLAAILHLLDRAGAEKPRLAELAERVAGRFVIAVLLLAAAAGVYWWHADSTRVLPIVVAVLVITCPCALALATPAALAAATATLTRRGLLVTRGHALERLAHATHFVFDKTGTLTEGRPTLAATRVLSSLPERECLRLAAALERHSEHPLARALTRAAPSPPVAREVVNRPGEGLHGTIDAETYYVGSPEYVARETSLSLDAARLEEWRAGGASLVLLASTRAWLAAFSFEDPLRPGARRLLDDLRRLGGSVTLLTGDHVAAAQRVAGELAIDDARANLRPADKLAAIRRLQADGAVVAMIGDGVNDAPVLAGADVSVAMGGAAHVSVAAADTVLLHNDLARLGEAVATARHARTVIRENLAWAVVYNVVAVPAAALGFVTPLLAAVGMSVSSLAVVLNAMRLLRRPAPEQ